MPARTETVASLARLVAGRIVGDPDHTITGVADLRHAGPTQVGFVANSRYARHVRQTSAGAVLVGRECEGANTAQIIVDQPQHRFARIVRHFHPTDVVEQHALHPTAVVHPDAILEAPVRIGPHACVAAGSTIGRGTTLHAGVVIGRDVKIGRNCTFHPRVTVYDGVTTGDAVIIHAGAVLGADGFGYLTNADGTRMKFPQVGTLVIGDDVEIGANTTLDRAALAVNRIGSGAKIDNLCHIGHNCTIGSNTVISALSAFAAETHLGDRVTVAGHVVSGGNVRVANDVVIGGNSVLTSDVLEPGQYAGYPLQPRVQAARTVVLHGHLADLREEMQRIRRELESSVQQ